MLLLQELRISKFIMLVFTTLTIFQHPPLLVHALIVSIQQLQTQEQEQLQYLTYISMQLQSLRELSINSHTETSSTILMALSLDLEQALGLLSSINTITKQDAHIMLPCTMV